MARGTPLVLTGSEGYAIGLINAIGPVGLGANNRIIYPVKGTARAVAGVADRGIAQLESIGKKGGTGIEGNRI